MKNPYGQLSAFDDKELVNVVVETPAGSRNKYSFDEKSGVFRLHSTLPMGLTFPYDFGFVPGTRAGDGDPIDVLLLTSQPAVVGSVVCARPIGVVKIQDGKERNDRIIAVWPEDPIYGGYKDFREIDDRARRDLDRFFEIYPKGQGRAVKLLGDADAAAATSLIKDARV